jgi:Ca2+-transporting ATPase
MSQAPSPSQPSSSPSAGLAAKRAPRSAHAEEVGAFLDALDHSSTSGLSTAEAERRLARDGPNSLPETPRKSWLLRLLAQFANPLVLTLLAAAVVALVVAFTSPRGGGFLGRFGDAIAILLIVVLNALLGLYQERRAEAALDALTRLTAPSARLRRDNKTVIVPARQAVVGDILELEAGDAIAADARLVQSIDFAVEEAALTGESAASVKDALAIVPEDAPLADRTTMVFTGTTVMRGKARAVITATGARTELGRIGEMIASVGDQKTPLEHRLDVFGKHVLHVCLALSVILLGWGFWRGGVWHDVLLEAVSLAVAAIPEGLPAITTITLALGMQRMARRGAIVRKLAAVETLGAATIIASDKTGTLTQNEMTARAVFAGGHHYTVSGEGYEPTGEFCDEDTGVKLDELSAPLRYTLATAALCNNAELQIDPDTSRHKIVGDPTEGALLTLAEKGDLGKESIRPQHEFVTELPFDSDRKRMTVITRDKAGREIAHVKGSVDVLLPRCVKISSDAGVRGLTEDDRTQILAEAERMSARTLRVLALCRRVRVSHDDGDRVEHELTFLGLVGLMDPPRAGVREAVATCKRAGIRAVMITGDHKITATAIAHEIGLWEESDESITGAELGAMTDDELKSRIMHVRVFARTTAEQKLRIVRAFKARGHVVAMTGDGVNDAPALREAHIGIAMGRGGTDVARQAADMVLADDNFASIVEAVREGRAIYRNIQKFIFFLLSSNMGLLVAVFAVSFIGKWPPLTPLMILWINLVTNGLPALALGVDPPDANLMTEPPRSTTEGLLMARDYLGILYVGACMGAAALFFYITATQQGTGLLRARALAFSVLAISPLFHAWSCRSPSKSLFASKPFFSAPLILACLASASIHLVALLVPTLRPVFKTYALTGTEWLMLLVISLLILPAVELAKGAQHLTSRSKPVSEPNV